LIQLEPDVDHFNVGLLCRNIGTERVSALELSITIAYNHFQALGWRGEITLWIRM